MKLRMLAMATVAGAALSTPAMAGEGWYLGIGGGWDQQESIQYRSVTNPVIGNRNSPASDNAIGMISVGYAWGNGWRLENEIALTSHDIKLAGFNGGDQVTSTMVNLNYDIPLGDTWKFTLGGGVGIGKDLYVSGSTFLYGDLTIYGSSSIVNISSSTVVIGDNRLLLNAGKPVSDKAKK